MIQNVLMQILDSAVIDEDIAFPLLTALVKTDAKATYNRYARYFTLLPMINCTMPFQRVLHPSEIQKLAFSTGEQADFFIR